MFFCSVFNQFLKDTFYYMFCISLVRCWVTCTFCTTLSYFPMLSPAKHTFHTSHFVLVSMYLLGYPILRKFFWLEFLALNYLENSQLTIYSLFRSYYGFVYFSDCFGQIWIKSKVLLLIFQKNILAKYPFFNKISGRMIFRQWYSNSYCNT